MAKIEQTLWNSSTDVLVGTSAIGCGIDVPDVRFLFCG